MESDTLTFIELSGPAAGSTLTVLGRSLAAAGTPCELLASATQAELYLLVCHGDGDVSAAPGDARTWSFRQLEAFR